MQATSFVLCPCLSIKMFLASVILHHHEACNSVAWPETLVSLVAKAKLECTQKRKFRCPPALIAACEGHRSRKNAFPKNSLPAVSLPKAALLLSLLLPAVKLMTKIPSCAALPPILHAR